MKTTFLDFEQSIAELESKIEELRFVQDDSAVDIAEEIERLEKKSAQLTKDVYAKLSPWQISQVARHPQRPYTLDYLSLIFSDFEELHGDRAFADDHAVRGNTRRQPLPHGFEPARQVGQAAQFGAALARRMEIAAA